MGHRALAQLFRRLFIVISGVREQEPVLAGEAWKHQIGMPLYKPRTIKAGLKRIVLRKPLATRRATRALREGVADPEARRSRNSSLDNGSRWPE